MKHVIAVLFCGHGLWPLAPDYNLNVHVTSSRMVMERGGGAHFQKVKAVIDGKKYELESIEAPNALLMPGDYKARIVKDHHCQRLRRVAGLRVSTSGQESSPIPDDRRS